MSCPDAKTLERLLHGRLPTAETDALARHLEECDHCVATVQALHLDDTLVAAARAQSTKEPETETAVVEAIIEKASGLYTTVSAVNSAPNHKGLSSDDLAGILNPPEHADELGRLGPYRILTVLGAGGMGVVFEAEDPHLHRRVAVKTLHPTLAACPAARERFLREARAVAAIEDERIVAIHHVGEERGVPFFAMPLLRGESLEERLRRAEQTTGVRMLPVAEAVRIAAEVAQGLASAHARGLIHRDIKPANIWLASIADCKLQIADLETQADPRPKASVHSSNLQSAICNLQFRVKILDFGLARGIDDALALTQPGVVAGTPAYLAPEQLAGAAVDERCDLFALGCVLYRMTTGRAPFAVARRDFATPTSPRELNPEVPVELSELIVQLLAREPERRPPSAQVVAARLAHIGEELSSVTLAPPPPPRRRRLAWTVASAAALTLIVALAGMMYVRHDRGEFVVEIDDPEIAILLAPAGGITLHDRKADRTFVLNVGKHDLPSGQYEIDLRGTATKLETSVARVTIGRGDQAKVTVSLRGQPRVWLNHVATLAAKQQLEAVAQRLRDLNPDFDGNIGADIQDGKVVEAHIFTDHVTDISPFRALGDLKILVVRGSGSAKGILEDISPVQSLKHLRYLDFSANRVKNLTPLRGMPLRELSCWANPIRDLMPLHGMPLTMLELNYTYASDLWPLHNMPLQRLHVITHYASDLTPLAGLPLVELQCRFRPLRHPQVLRSIKSLAKINDRPVAEFWKEHDERQAALEPWLKRVTAMDGKEQASAVTAKLRELNPGFEQYVSSKIENGAVTEIGFQTDHVTDISPVSALSNLRLLSVSGSHVVKLYEGKFFDLDPVRDLPIGHLQVANTIVGDLSNLPAKLQVLVCSNTPVRDLRPVRAYPLFYLDCSGTLVDDLAPLKGTGIGHLFVKNARLKDLSPLAGMKIHELQADLEPTRDAALLRSIKELRLINGKAPDEFWKELQTN